VIVVRELGCKINSQIYEIFHSTLGKKIRGQGDVMEWGDLTVFESWIPVIEVAIKHETK